MSEEREQTEKKLFSLNEGIKQESATANCPVKCGHGSCRDAVETRRWRAENRKWGRQLILMVNNMYEDRGEIPSWDEFKELWEDIQE